MNRVTATLPFKRTLAKALMGYMFRCHVAEVPVDHTCGLHYHRILHNPYSVSSNGICVKRNVYRDKTGQYDELEITAPSGTSLGISLAEYNIKRNASLVLKQLTNGIRE